MELHSAHPWRVTPAQAIEIQESLRARVIVTDALGPVTTVAGVDVGLLDGTARAAVAVLDLDELELREYATALRPLDFPYIPGLLSFREVPVVLDALAKLRVLPDLILCDGQGIAHPRRLGIASHLGVLVDLPTVGVAKTLLVGRHEPVPQERGASRPIIHRGEIVGAALCTRPGVKPVFVSPGHRVSLATALRYAMRCTTKYRLPETTRWAHRLASGARS